MLSPQQGYLLCTDLLAFIRDQFVYRRSLLLQLLNSWLLHVVIQVPLFPTPLIIQKLCLCNNFRRNYKFFLWELCAFHT